MAQATGDIKTSDTLSVAANTFDCCRDASPRGHSDTQSDSSSLPSKRRPTSSSSETVESHIAMKSNPSQVPDASPKVFTLRFLHRYSTEEEVVSKLEKFGKVSYFIFKENHRSSKYDPKQVFRQAEFCFECTLSEAGFKEIKRIRIKGLQVKIGVRSSKYSPRAFTETRRSEFSDGQKPGLQFNNLLLQDLDDDSSLHSLKPTSNKYQAARSHVLPLWYSSLGDSNTRIRYSLL